MSPEIRKLIEEHPEEWKRDAVPAILGGIDTFTFMGKRFTTKKPVPKYSDEKSNLPSGSRRGPAFLQNLYQFCQKILRKVRFRSRRPNRTVT